MKKIPLLVLAISLALSSAVAQAKDKKDEPGFFPAKKTHLVCDRKNCRDAHAKFKVDYAKGKKSWKSKHHNKHKKDKKHPWDKPKKDKPGTVEAVPEINAGGAAMAFVLAGILILVLRERRMKLVA